MNRDVQDNLLLLTGAAMLAVGLSDVHLRYVKPAMQPLVVLSGVVLLAFGLRGLVRIVRDIRADDSDLRTAGAAPGDDDDAQDPHGHGSTGTAWFLALPLLVLCLLSPPALGAYTAARSDTALPEPDGAFEPLPPARDGAVDLTLSDYYLRVQHDPASLSGARVRLTGFVTPMQDRWFVTRIALACCAADGQPVKILAAGPGAVRAPSGNTWVEVVGRYGPPEVLPEADVSVASLVLEQLRVVDEPRVPYE